MDQGINKNIGDLDWAISPSFVYKSTGDKLSTYFVFKTDNMSNLQLNDKPIPIHQRKPGSIKQM